MIVAFGAATLKATRLVRVAKRFSRRGIVHTAIWVFGINGKIGMFREIAVLVCDRKAEKTLVAFAAGNAGFCRYTSSPDLRPLRPFMWQPIIFDPGTAMALLALPEILREARQTSRWSLLEEYVGTQGIRDVRFRPYQIKCIQFANSLDERRMNLALRNTGSSEPGNEAKAGWS